MIFAGLLRKGWNRRMTIKRVRVGRRPVLKALGASAVGGTFLTGTASARPNHYGNGNGIGAWLNEKPSLIGQKVWDGGIVDRTGEDEIEINFNALLVVDGETIGPFAVEPRAVKVSPGTTVRWNWEAPPGHNLVSFFHPPHSGPEDWEDDNGGFAVPPADAPFEFEFENRGNYLYYCHPHGTPYEAVAGPEGQFVGKNLLGHRGVVKVVGNKRD